MTSLDCADVREAISARADGEDLGADATAVADHLDVCAACARFAAHLPAVTRRTRLSAAQEVPDLTDAIVTAVAASPPPEPRRTRDLRILVGLAGGAQLLLALPMLLGLVSPDLHVGRDLGTLQVALGVGLVLAALQPRRAAGLFPVVAVVGAITIVAATIDVVTGAATLTAELTHLAELVGVAALWGLTRQRPRPSWRSVRDGLRMEPV